MCFISIVSYLFYNNVPNSWMNIKIIIIDFLCTPNSLHSGIYGKLLKWVCHPVMDDNECYTTYSEVNVSILYISTLGFHLMWRNDIFAQHTRTV